MNSATEQTLDPLIWWMNKHHDGSDEAQAILAKLRPADREPPHCSTCACGMSPAHEREGVHHNSTVIRKEVLRCLLEHAINGQALAICEPENTYIREAYDALAPAAQEAQAEGEPCAECGGLGASPQCVRCGQLRLYEFYNGNCDDSYYRAADVDAILRELRAPRAVLTEEQREALEWSVRKLRTETDLAITKGLYALSAQYSDWAGILRSLIAQGRRS